MCESILPASLGLAPTPPMVNDPIIKCPICHEPYKEPKVLACFHSYCKGCLELLLGGSVTSEKIICPSCKVETILSVQFGIDRLLSDYGIENVLSRQLSEDKGLIFGSPSSTSSSPPLLDSPYEQNGNISSPCTGCKSGERAQAFCQDCSHFLCTSCRMAHQFMHCFDGHRVDELQDGAFLGLADKTNCRCIQHSQPIRYFCSQCCVAICYECTRSDHSDHLHELIEDIAEKELAVMETLVRDARIKQEEFLDKYKAVDAAHIRLNFSMANAQHSVEEAVQALNRVVDDCRRQMLKEIDDLYSVKQLQLSVIDKKVQQMTEKLSQTIEFTERLMKYSSAAEIMVFKQLLQSRLEVFLNYNADAQNVLQTPFIVDFQQQNSPNFRQQVMNLLGTVRSSEWPAASLKITGLPAPIGKPPANFHLNRSLAAPTPSIHFTDTNLLCQKHDFGGSDQSLISFGTFDSNGVGSQYEKWSMGLDIANGIQLTCSSENDGSDRLSGSSIVFAPRAQIKRQKMIYHCKFGEFGVLDGQFTEPSGVAVNIQNDIIVADTNNHRIQVFDKEGHFKFQFGECGKRDGQLLYPNRVAVNRSTGDFIVTERSPTHQIQIYNQYGQFVRKFGANILQHPRGVCVDNKGRIIVVECKVMRVIIFDSFGNILHKFSCSRYLEFPNGVCTNNKQEILISDNRAHCIKVFNYEGHFLRQIGGEGITNYPIGVGINSNGDIVVADNHNNFNLTVFNQDGIMVSALESKVKHAQCFDVALVEDGSVVLASKDYRLYLYRYQTTLV